MLEKVINETSVGTKNTVLYAECMLLFTKSPHDGDCVMLLGLDMFREEGELMFEKMFDVSHM